MHEFQIFVGSGVARSTICAVALKIFCPKKLLYSELSTVPKQMFFFEGKHSLCRELDRSTDRTIQKDAALRKIYISGRRTVFSLQPGLGEEFLGPGPSLKRTTNK